jgi:hypothetical protein
MPNHSRAWHNANEAVKAAQRDLADAERFYQDKAWKIREAQQALESARSQFAEIDQNDDLAYDQ